VGLKGIDGSCDGCRDGGLAMVMGRFVYQCTTLEYS
jgi:hypothetical protein